MNKDFQSILHIFNLTMFLILFQSTKQIFKVSCIIMFLLFSNQKIFEVFYKFSMYSVSLCFSFSVTKNFSKYLKYFSTLMNPYHNRFSSYYVSFCCYFCLLLHITPHATNVLLFPSSRFIMFYLYIL